MNHFFKTFFACLLAIFVSGIAFIILSFMIFAGMIATLGTFGSGRNTATLQPHSVLRIDLAQPIVDKPNGNALDLFDYSEFSFREQTTLYDATTQISRAAEDPDIDGIYLNIPMAIPTSVSTLYELRQALVEFRESGKFVISYADVYSQSGYYLASVSDKVYLNPQGGLAWQGLASSVLFYKGLLDKLGVQAELIRHGSFKGAGEPFILTRLSDANRLQMESMTNSIWDYLISEIAESRELAADSLQAYASRLAVATPYDALRLGFVDSLWYRDRMTEELARLSGQDTTGKPQILSLTEYKAAGHSYAGRGTTGNMRSSNEIALVYADGDIVDAGDKNKQIVGNALAETLAGVRKDDDVKAVVLRVNSPGGSALAAEIIWREVYLTQQVKPVIVSMGNYAASGGYYISCGAEYIVTAPTTLTGSIGVFGLMFNVGEGAREHLGLTADGVRTNPSADMGNLFRPLSPAERMYIQNGVDTVYARFVEVVAQGRRLRADSVDALAGGRVWTGVQAMENGLADCTGTLQDAIRIAAEHAGLEPGGYAVRQYPAPESSSFASILGSLTGSAMMKITGGDRLPELGAEARHVREMISNAGIRAEMPWRVELQD
ncbi:signal peptide peptidase SppA [uncultured Rikenella sp.]|uniref:signal peptide peptidase SppA n=1 Tax=uncultured Rikenella sp. TaxID=368003 RepID=UPI00262C62DB|nr:signal peptide peptidase SppA [uncultured Rikenella sp.]